MAPLWLYQLSLNAVLLIDSFMLSSAVTSLGLDAGLDATAAAAVGNQYVADYSAARKFALVPYQLMLSMTFIVFPMISRATSSGDEEGARHLLRSALRFSLLVLVAVAAPIAGAADGVMRIAYTEEYLTGSGALQVLVLGAACFALFVITATALSGAGRPTTAAIIAGIGLVTVLIGNYVLVRLVGIGEHTVVAAASATSAGMFLTLVVSGVLVYQRFKAFLSPATVVRTAIAGGIAFATSYFVPHDSRMSALAALVLGGLAFVAALVVLREVTTNDLAQVRRILRR
jgi:stage V sporulation protein B